jgi:hypothetical protein
MKKTESQQAFDRGMRDLSAAFGRDITPDVARVYARVLERFTAKQLTKAFARAIEEERYFPAPAGIRARIDQEKAALPDIGKKSEWTRAQVRLARWKTRALVRTIETRTVETIGPATGRR